MQINKIFILTTFFSAIGIFAGDSITIRNSVASRIKVHIIDQNEKFYETKEVQGGATSTMKQCSAGRILVVDWGEKEKDGRPKVVGLSFTTEKSCGRKYIFTSNLEIVEDKEINLRPFSLK